MARTEDLTVEQITAALVKHKGLVYKTAQALKVTPKTIYNYLDRYPELKDVCSEQRELLVDTAEASLLRAIQKGESWAVSLALKTLGKNRGYVERQELTGKDGSDLNRDTIIVKWDNDDRSNPT